MRSYTTRRFREAYAALPEEARHEENNVYSARVGLGYRALGALDGSEIAWFWIGPHSEYDRFI
jgi:hypothetical protein